jgi:hypothetical protein
MGIGTWVILEIDILFGFIKTETMKNYWICLLLIIIGIPAVAQNDQEVQKEYKNTIRYNISSPSILGFENIIFGYERILGNHHSFSFEIGQNKLPYFVVGEEGSRTEGLDLTSNNKGSGLHIAGDYRFYLKSENKFNAPRGVYIGPFYSFNTFNRNNGWELNSEEFQGNFETDLYLRIHSIGGELGYQFQLGKRLMLDLTVFGPGIGFYKVEANSNTNLSPEDERLLYEKINEILSEKFPGFSNVITGDGFERTGSSNTIGYGYRFMLNIGYRF